jgi:hypothetical protein
MAKISPFLGSMIMTEPPLMQLLSIKAFSKALSAIYEMVSSMVRTTLNPSWALISFGYKNGGDNKWVINEEEAPRVREAFRMASEGKCYRDILAALNEMETDGNRWRQQRLRYLLTNVAYKGDYYSHKTVSLVPGQQVRNNGLRDRYYLTGHHEPIVSPQLFDWVQEIIKRDILNSHKRPSLADLEFLRAGNELLNEGGTHENSNKN